MNSQPVPNPAAAWEFLKTLWPQTSELILAIEPEGGSPFGRRYTVDQAEEFTANLPGANLRLDTYFSINLPRSAMNKKPLKADIGTIRAVFVDLDPDKSKPIDAECERIRLDTTDEALAAKGLPLPTVRVYSGGGCWLYWVLRDPISVPAWASPHDAPEIVRRVDGIGRRIASLFPHGDSCFNIDRIARLPGTVNWASLNPRKPGRVDALATVDEIHPARRYALEDFPEPLYESAPAATSAAVVPVETPAEPDHSVTIADLPTPELRRVAEHGCDPENAARWTKPGSGVLDKSKMLHWFYCACIREGVAQARALGFTLGNYGIANACNGKKPSPLAYAQTQWRKAQAAEAHRVARVGSKAGGGFVRDERDSIIANQHNIRVGLGELGVTIWWDDFADRMCVDGLDGFGPYIDDAAANRLRLRLDSRFGFLPSAELFNSVVLDIAFDNRRNPVGEYLDTAQAAWDGTPRLDTVLSAYFGAEDTELHRAIGPIVFIAAVRRIRKPGCKFDEILILESEQGQNKSSAWRALAVSDRWFTDDLQIGARTKEVLEVVEGVWIAELSELRGMKASEVEGIKAFASRQEDRARLAYGRYTTYRPRRFIMVGSTNDRKYLRDGTGNRRFWPVATGRIDLERIRADRDQLWAEAAVREAAGESIRLDPSLWQAAAAVQAEREDTGALDDFLGDLLGDLEGVIVAEDLWAVLGKPMAGQRDQRANADLGAAIRRLGWQRPSSGKQLRFGGVRRTCYVKGDARHRLVFEQDQRGRWAVQRPFAEHGHDYGLWTGVGSDHWAWDGSGEVAE
jgi:hypothetical protein